MNYLRHCRHYRAIAFVSLLGSSLLITGCVKTELSTQAPAITKEITALVDRAAIENLYAEYYSHIGTSSTFEFSKFFAEDGVLDVNGMVANGADEIKAMYARAGADSDKPVDDPKTPPRGGFNMQVSNLKIEVNGDAAVADLLWNGFSAKFVTSAPVVTEFGREHSELVKRNGHWSIKHRVVTTGGGMPESLLKNYVKR